MPVAAIESLIKNTYCLENSGSVTSSSQTLHNGNASDLLWIDTLCVPINEPGKTEAINDMNAAYNDLKITIVLDESLLKGLVNALSTELIARIVSSDWIRRLWTLLEALISRKRLVFRFADKAVHLQKLYKLDEKSQHAFDYFLPELHANFVNTMNALAPQN